MSNASEQSTGDDAYWRRPEDQPPGESPRQRGLTDASPAAPYLGPPPTSPPPHGWQPPRLVQPPAPRTLPPQDTHRVDREEQVAKTMTTGIGLVTGAVLIVLLLVLCGRWLF